MKELLYIQNCYMKEFNAEVIEVIDGKNIILDQTAFYPTAGGQPNDTGKIICNGIEYNIIDVKKSEGKIIQIVNKEGINIGDKIHGIIDWDRRYKLMRYHTAAHILSTVIHEETGADITGNQLYTDKARIDFSLENFDREVMKSFEKKVNDLINKNISVSFRILNREEAFKIPSLCKLRKELPENITEIRIVDIADDSIDLDHTACGGTHISNISEIGNIEIYDVENKGKERRRIYFRIKE